MGGVEAQARVLLEAASGIDPLEISGGTYESRALFGLAEDDPPTGDSPRAEAYFVEFARRVRAAAPDMTIVLSGGLRIAAAMESLLVRTQSVSSAWCDRWRSNPYRA